VIILTRGAAFGPVLRGLRAGAKFLLAKPFNPQILVKAVEFLLGERNSEELSKLEADLLTSTGVFFSLLGRAEPQHGQATA
jgi:DNA-binding response OmpR family regulator